MADPVLPPSRFGTGYTVGNAPAASPSRPPAAVGAAVGRRPDDPSRAYPGSSQPISADGYGAIDTAPPANRLAGVSFVLALLLGPVVAPMTVPMAMVASRQISRSGQGGAGLATAALAISVIYLAFGLTIVGLYIALGPSG